MTLRAFRYDIILVADESASDSLLRALFIKTALSPQHFQ